MRRESALALGEALGEEGEPGWGEAGWLEEKLEKEKSGHGRGKKQGGLG